MKIAVVGQTATGKSALAVEIARALGNADKNGIVSADAYQLYRLMDIGTAKITAEEQRGIEHFQLDVLDIHQDASVAAYQKHATHDLNTIEQRGGTALMAGGSGLYLRAVMDGLAFPATDPHLRAQLEQRLISEGAQALHDHLERLDPASAHRIPADNTRRVVRALEVCLLTGQPFSATLPTYDYVDDWVQIGLTWPQEILNQRIHQRSSDMFAAGWLDEISTLMAHGFEDTKTASRACGYAQAVAVWRGELTLEEGIEAVADATVKLTKKQWKWFKRDPRITWINAGDGTYEGLDGDRLLTALTQRCLQIIHQA